MRQLFTVCRAGGFFVLAAVLIFSSPTWAETSQQATEVPEDFPRFLVPGYEREMDLLRRLNAA